MGCEMLDALLLNGRHVLLGWGCTFAEEILFHLLHDSFLILPASRIQAIFVQQHFAEFRPTPPSFLGDIVENLLSKFRVKGWLIQAWKFPLQFDTENFALSHSSPQNSVGKIISHASGFSVETTTYEALVFQQSAKSCLTLILTA